MRYDTDFLVHTSVSFLNARLVDNFLSEQDKKFLDTKTEQPCDFK